MDFYEIFAVGSYCAYF